MITVSRSNLVLIGTVVVFISATIDVATKNVLAAENRSQPHISFSSPSYSIEKTKADVKGDREGWRETAEWRSTQGEAFVFVNIFAHVSYNKVIMRSHVRSAEKRVYDISGGATVSLGSQGKALIENGFYDYQIYSLNGVQCVYIQSYWGDKSFGGIDIVRGAKKSDTIVGNHMLQVNFCDQHKQEMRSKDVTEILSNIDLRDAHWSSSWFGADNNSAVSGTYRSELSGNLRRFFKDTNIKVRLVQSGNKITGTFLGAKGDISGEIDDNTVRFSAKPPYGNWTISGKWVFTTGYKEAAGDAGYHVTKGFWNLTKIE